MIAIRLIKYRLLLAALLQMAVMSCHQKVDWLPPDFDQKPAVSSIIKSGERISVKVSLAAAINDQPHPDVDNAEVLLYVDNEYLETLEYIGDGFYQSQHVAQKDRGYKCEVNIPNYQTAVCSTYIPKNQNIIEFAHINKAGIDEEGRSYPAVKVTFSSVPNQRIYYQIVITTYSKNIKWNPILLNSSDPVLLNEGLLLAVFSNELIEGNSYTMIINYTTGSASNNSNLTGWVTDLFPVRVELRTVCFNYYKFIKQQHLYEHSTSEPIFSVGATSTFNLHSNVENGYGIFAGYSSVKSEIISP